MTLRLTLAFAVGLLAACGGDDETSSSSSGSPADGGSSRGAGTLTVIDGIEIPVSIETCDERVSPIVSKNDITFTWKAHPGANQYAVRARKSPNGIGDVETFAGVQAEIAYAYGERVAETKYVIDVYALNDRAPLCTYLGVNGTTPH